MRTMRILALTAALTAAFATVGHAQTALTLGTGFGATIPMGDAADGFKVGWHAQANLGFTNPDWPVGIRIDGMYHSLGGEEFAGVDGPGADIIAGTANLQLFLSRTASGGGLFAMAGGGMYNIDFGEEGDLFEGSSTTKAGILGGLGYRIAMTNLVLSLEGKYHHIFTEGSATQLIPLTVAVEIPLR